MTLITCKCTDKLPKVIKFNMIKAFIFKEKASVGTRLIPVVRSIKPEKITFVKLDSLKKRRKQLVKN